MPAQVRSQGGLIIRIDDRAVETEDREIQKYSRWIGMLENLYMIFRIYPFGAPKIRAVKKEEAPVKFVECKTSAKETNILKSMQFAAPIN